MKYSFLIALMFISLFAGAQCFQRGTLVFDLNTGFEFYNTTLKYKTGETIKGSAGNVGFSLGAEVGLSKRVGIGLRGKANTFASDVDAVSREEVNLKSTDLLFIFNLHPIVRKKLDIILGAEAGFSGLDFEFNNFEHLLQEGNGGYFSLYANPRVYFGRFGINMKAYLPFVSYQYFKTNSSGTQVQQSLLNKWNGNGIGVSIGVQVRLF